MPLLVGVEYFRIRAAEDYDVYNAAVVVDAEGQIAPQWTAKHYLVPFVEALPFRRLLGPLLQGRGGEWHWITGAFRPAPDNVVLEVAGARAGILVCFEELFPDLTRKLRSSGAEFQVLITNDAWWGRTAFQRYLTDALRLRAIEIRSDFVRAANTGISGFVDRWGRDHRLTPLFQPAMEVWNVARTARPTLYSRLGDSIVILLVVGLAAALVTAVKASSNPRN